MQLFTLLFGHTPYPYVAVITLLDLHCCCAYNATEYSHSCNCITVHTTTVLTLQYSYTMLQSTYIPVLALLQCIYYVLTLQYLQLVVLLWLPRAARTFRILSFHRPKDGKEDLGTHAYAIRSSSHSFHARVHGDLSVSIRLSFPYKCGSA